MFCETISPKIPAYSLLFTGIVRVQLYYVQAAAALEARRIEKWKTKTYGLTASLFSCAPGKSGITTSHSNFVTAFVSDAIVLMNESLLTTGLY